MLSAARGLERFRARTPAAVPTAGLEKLCSQPAVEKQPGHLSPDRRSTASRQRIVRGIWVDADGVRSSISAEASGPPRFDGLQTGAGFPNHFGEARDLSFQNAASGGRE